MCSTLLNKSYIYKYVYLCRDNSTKPVLGQINIPDQAVVTGNVS